MRLGNTVKAKIQAAAKESFGDVDLYLFGGRADDAKKGGDIDIAVDTNPPTREFKKKKARFFAKLMRNDVEFGVDIVDYSTKNKLLSREIKDHALLLR